MMNRYSIALSSDPDDRVFFFYWSDLIEHLRGEMEADGFTYRMKITDWKKMAAKNKANCQLQWVRVNPVTQMAEMVTRTVRCEDTDVLPTEPCYFGSHVRMVWTRAEW